MKEDYEARLLRKLREMNVIRVRWSCYAYHDEYEFRGEPTFTLADGTIMKDWDSSLDYFWLQDISYASCGTFVGTFVMDLVRDTLTTRGEVSPITTREAVGC